jgi:hypothetical protein
LATVGTILQDVQKLGEIAWSWIVNTIISADVAIVALESGRRTGLAPRLQSDTGDEFRMEWLDDGNRSISSPIIPSI